MTAAMTVAVITTDRITTSDTSIVDMGEPLTAPGLVSVVNSPVVLAASDSVEGTILSNFLLVDDIVGGTAPDIAGVSCIDVISVDENELKDVRNDADDVTAYDDTVLVCGVSSCTVFDIWLNVESKDDVRSDVDTGDGDVDVVWNIDDVMPGLSTVALVVDDSVLLKVVVRDDVITLDDMVVMCAGVEDGCEGAATVSTTSEHCTAKSPNTGTRTSSGGTSALNNYLY